MKIGRLISWVALGPTGGGFAHGVWRHLRSDGVGGAPFGHGDGQLDRSGGEGSGCNPQPADRIRRLPFGLRLQDQSVFIFTATGINMTTPDQGVEFGWEHGHWDAQFAVSNGTAGGAVTSNGKQSSGQLSFVESLWRVGIAANFNAQSGGSKSAAGIFGGLKTGPISWLAQAELTKDESIANDQGKQLATLLEANWLITRGNNLKITQEFLNPNRAVPNGERTRWSLVYELSPIQFVQIRTGLRYYDGIPQDDSQHQRQYFVELHGFF